MSGFFKHPLAQVLLYGFLSYFLGLILCEFLQRTVLHPFLCVLNPFAALIIVYGRSDALRPSQAIPVRLLCVAGMGFLSCRMVFEFLDWNGPLDIDEQIGLGTCFIVICYGLYLLETYTGKRHGSRHSQ